MSLFGTINPNPHNSTEARSTAQHGPYPELDGEFPKDEASDEKEHGTGNTSSNDSLDLEKVISHEARSLTRINTTHSIKPTYENPFIGEVAEDSPLNPHSPNFNPRAWIKNLLAIQSRDPERYPQRTAGIAFRNLSVHGFGSPTDYQKDVLNSVLQIEGLVRKLVGRGQQTKIQILDHFDGVVESGEMLVVLGRPGSGCSTLLKTITGELNGLYLDADSHVNYQGISAKQMHNQFRGEAIYTAETDVHFPQLTVGQTLSFAARARAPRNRLPGVSRKQYGDHMRDVIMAIFGLKHTIHTKVGNDFIRGVSGGERKRVSISEAALSGAPLQCWDNSTRGLDSANAVEFCKTLRTETDLLGSTAVVAIYQAPQSAFDIFDKVTVLYEGRQIYFGKTTDAKQYFLDLGFECPERQTVADFLTSVTSLEEAVVKGGWEGRVPRSPEEFSAAWRKSAAYSQLQQEITAYDQRYPIDGESRDKFINARKAQQSNRQRIQSPYTLSLWEQVELCTQRGFERLRGDASLTLTQLFGNFIMAVIIGSIFYNLPKATSSFYSRGALLFFAVLLNAFGSALEILTLYAQRPIVEKHARYALYHPFAEAISSMLCDLPYKLLNSITFNLAIYFLTNLRRTPPAYFTFWLFSLVTTLVMSMIFRTIGASSRTLAQALAPSALLILALVIYTGFAIPTRNMLGWSRWINYIDPIGYAFESLMVNEFSGQTYECSAYVPTGQGYDNVSPLQHICSTVGAVAGSNVVDGDAYLAQSFQYYRSHLWRNLGIIFGFMIFFLFTYLMAAEYISEQKSKGEVLLFRRGHAPKALTEGSRPDPEKGTNDAVNPSDMLEKATSDRLARVKSQKAAAGNIQEQTAIFHWRDVCFDIKIKNEERRILDHVDGWVKPGTLTALMGVSGAGKTSLLDVLATRATIGVIHGEMLVDGKERDDSFQRKTGYVQQQDLHLSTATVRESLRFSALLRQPRNISRKEKLDYVEEVITLLDMTDYADAVVGVPGEGLNVEQRKRLTIGVELAAKPQLLLFLDEPTSGLDSQTSWSILNLLDTLKNHGQAILCTIHQPSAVLFQRFDRLLFLATGGRTVYYGDIGEKSSIMTNYFERNGAKPCPPDDNPAEWMLEVIGAAPGSKSDIDWHQVWRNSPEFTAVHRHLDELKAELSQQATAANTSNDKDDYREFAAPFAQQLWECQLRVFSQYWRTPSYIYSKAALSIGSALFIGFSFFKAKNSEQGLQNQLFAVFMLMIIFGNLVQQIMPNFVVQRALYEARERPAKTYSWKAFMLANIFVELPWNTLMAVLIFFCWYFPIGLYRNAAAAGQLTEREGLMFLFIWAFLMFTSTFAHMVIAGIDLAETGGNIANLIFSLSLVFCGVLATPTALPGFWIFMYRVSPLTYLVSGMLSVGVANTNVVCEDVELLTFNPPSGQTCQKYLADYISYAGGYLTNPSATTACEFCSVSSTNTYLAAVNISYTDRWRNFGLMWVYIITNVALAVVFYYFVRVPKKSKAMKA